MNTTFNCSGRFGNIFFVNMVLHFIASKNNLHTSYKYNLHIFQSDEVDTIQFANTCKYVVLSSGTFSWLIGLFAYYSKVYYPNIVRQWHGDIFVFPDWIRIKGTYGSLKIPPSLT